MYLWKLSTHPGVTRDTDLCSKVLGQKNGPVTFPHVPVKTEVFAPGTVVESFSIALGIRRRGLSLVAKASPLCASTCFKVLL